MMKEVLCLALDPTIVCYHIVSDFSSQQCVSDGLRAMPDS